MANTWSKTMAFLGIRDLSPRVDTETERRLAELERRVEALESAANTDDDNDK